MSFSRAGLETDSRGPGAAHCRDVHFDGDPAVVEVLMHRLRRKIEAPDDAAGPLIETVRGRRDVIRPRP